jgi:hypothetical protein
MHSRLKRWTAATEIAPLKSSHFKAITAKSRTGRQTKRLRAHLAATTAGIPVSLAPSEEPALVGDVGRGTGLSFNVHFLA